MRILNLLLVILVALSLISCGIPVDNLISPITRIIKSPQGNGYESYSSVRWSENSLPVRIVAPSSKKELIEPSLRSVCEKWNRAAGRDVIVYSFEEYESNNTSMTAIEDGKNRLYFSDSWSNLGQSDDSLAVTYYSYYGGVMVMKEGDIVFNVGNQIFYTDFSESKMFTNISQYDFESMLLHEVGHFMGLDHSSDADSVMLPSISNNALSRDLSLEDIREIFEKYN